MYDFYFAPPFPGTKLFLAGLSFGEFRNRIVGAWATFHSSKELLLHRLASLRNRLKCCRPAVVYTAVLELQRTDSQVVTREVGNGPDLHGLLASALAVGVIGNFCEVILKVMEICCVVYLIAAVFAPLMMPQQK